MKGITMNTYRHNVKDLIDRLTESIEGLPNILISRMIVSDLTIKVLSSVFDDEEFQYIDVGVEEIDEEKVVVTPRNLFTYLTLIGLYVPYHKVAGKNEIELPEGTFGVKDGQCYFEPHKVPEYIDITQSISLN